jgi:exodeoxyribonuclease VII small subunit
MDERDDEVVDGTAVLDDAPASYAAAEAELEQILGALEEEGVDVDELSAHVRRARTLITWCRARVAVAEVTITELLDEAGSDTSTDDMPVAD